MCAATHPHLEACSHDSQTMAARTLSNFACCTSLPPTPCCTLTVELCRILHHPLLGMKDEACYDALRSTMLPARSCSYFPC